MFTHKSVSVQPVVLNNSREKIFIFFASTNGSLDWTGLVVLFCRIFLLSFLSSSSSSILPFITMPKTLVEQVESFFYEDPSFQAAMESFAEKHCAIIDLSTEENKLE